MMIKVQIKKIIAFLALLTITGVYAGVPQSAPQESQYCDNILTVNMPDGEKMTVCIAQQLTGNTYTLPATLSEEFETKLVSCIMNRKMSSNISIFTIDLDDSNNVAVFTLDNKQFPIDGKPIQVSVLLTERANLFTEFVRQVEEKVDNFKEQMETRGLFIMFIRVDKHNNNRYYQETADNCEIELKIEPNETISDYLRNFPRIMIRGPNLKSYPMRSPQAPKVQYVIYAYVDEKVEYDGDLQIEIYHPK